jgi:hypothetical protein
MSLAIPKSDGDVLTYNLAGSSATDPRIYYVNGIQTEPKEHAEVAATLSLITERPVVGVYNATGGKGKAGGFVADLAQCADDWLSSTGMKLLEWGNLAANKTINGFRDAGAAAGHFVRDPLGRNPPALPPSAADPFNTAGVFRKAIPEPLRVKAVQWRLSQYNRATASLFNQLRTHSAGRQWIVAHSQGNLITCDALWAMVLAFGELSLDAMKVFSLASPSPAWPLGIRGGRRKVYGHTDDVVTLADPHNWPLMMKMAAAKAVAGPPGAAVAAGTAKLFARTAGDWRRHGFDASNPIAAHDVLLHLDPQAFNFANRIRQYLGLGPLSEKVTLAK